MNSVPIHLQRWIGSLRIQFVSPQTKFKCERNQCKLNSVLVSSVKGPIESSETSTIEIAQTMKEQTCGASLKEQIQKEIQH